MCFACTRIPSPFQCVENVRVWSFSGPFFRPFGLNTERYQYLNVFSPNVGKYGPEKLQMRTIFTQCFTWSLTLISLLPLNDFP